MNRKKLLLVFLFVALLFAGDSLIGMICRSVLPEMTTGKFGLINKSVRTKSDIFILGSSRAQNHYDSKILEEVSGKTAFNAGIGGQGVFSSYAILKERVKHSSPKIVLLDCAPNIMVDDEQFEKLSTFNPIADIYPSFGEIIKLNSDSRPFMLYSNSYRYNSTLFDYIFFAIKGDDNSDAYTPLAEKLNVKTFKPFFYDADSLDKEAQANVMSVFRQQLEYLYKIKKLCDEKGIKLICVISPSYIDHDKSGHVRREMLAGMAQHSIDYFDFTNDKKFSDVSFFRDQLHLNTVGSQIFSAAVGDSINKITKKL